LLEKATLDYWSPKNADKAREFVQKYTKELADLVMAEVAVRKLGFGHPYLYSIYFSPLHQGTRVTWLLAYSMNNPGFFIW
jgi:hypothetical protein